MRTIDKPQRMRELSELFTRTGSGYAYGMRAEFEAGADGYMLAQKTIDARDWMPSGGCEGASQPDGLGWPGMVMRGRA